MNTKQNIVLTGLMGSGKTTIGKIIAHKTGMQFLDTDELIVQQAGKPIKEIFANEGEEFFRDLESQIIKEVSSQANTVISTGGGAVLRFENTDYLREKGVIFYLYAPAEVIWERIKDDSERPLINNPNPLETLQLIQRSREIIYNEAEFKIFTSDKSPEACADEIIAKFKTSKM